MQDRFDFDLILKTVKPEFSYTLEKLVGVTQQCINKALELLWASTQQKSVVPKIEASIKSVQVPPFVLLLRLEIVLIYAQHWQEK